MFEAHVMHFLSVQLYSYRLESYACTCVERPLAEEHELANEIKELSLSSQFEIVMPAEII